MSPWREFWLRIAMLVIATSWVAIGIDRREWGWVALFGFYLLWVLVQLGYAQRKIERKVEQS